MKKIWHIGWNDIKLMVRDKVFFVWTLLFPLVFIFIFGNLYRGDTGPAQASLMVLNQDRGQWGAYFIEKIKSPGIALELIEEEPENYNRILVIPGDFSEKIENKTAQELVFKKHADASVNAAAQVKTRIIQAIAKVITELILHGDRDLATFFNNIPEKHAKKQAFEMTPPKERHQTDREWVGGATPLFEKKSEFKNIIEIKTQFPEGTLTKIPSGFDHVIPGILVQFIMLMVLIYGGISVMTDRKSGVLSRILFSSASIPVLWGGKFLGRLLMGIIQALILIVTGILFFRLNLGNYFLSLLNVLVFSIAIASLSIFIGSVLKKEDLIIGISVLLANLFAALGGCWWPSEIVPQTFKTIGMISPAYWAMDAFHRIIFFNKGLADILMNFIVLLGFTVIFTLLAVKFFKIKE
jgi:ABC-type multidrug transport system permease subunit